MTHRIAIALILCLAAACAVTGEEEEPTLEEIEASCSSDRGSREPGELKNVTLSSDGKPVSYDRLSRGQRRLLDHTLDFIEGSGHSGDTGCDFREDGWTCEGDAWVCSCDNLSTGPQCDCHEAC
jgi:hypothetical protein